MCRGEGTAGAIRTLRPAGAEGSSLASLRWRGSRRVGTLPMRNGSWHGAAHQCESANPCICNICHTVPVDESPPCAVTFCGKVYHEFQSGLKG
jgi:hypothetical protein